MKRRGGPPARRREPSDSIMTVQGVAEYLLCHPATIYRLLKQHQIPGFRLGREWRFERSAIDEWTHHR
jgi:excisionase family DNA binding protein